MLLFKTIAIPSGFNRKRLGELLKTYEKTDPQKEMESIKSLSIPDPLYRVDWVSNEEFDFQYFPYIERRDFGYIKAQTVRVKITGSPSEPILLVRVPSKVWRSHFLSLAVMGAFFAVVVAVGIYSPKNDFNKFLRVLQLIAFYGTVFAVSFFYVFSNPTVCETRLRHMVAKDDWDPDVTKPALFLKKND